MNPGTQNRPHAIVPRAQATARASLGIVAAALLCACAVFAPRFARPDLSVVDVRLLGGNLFQQNIQVTLDIQNPNDRALPVEHVSASLVIDGEQIASGATSRAFIVPARGRTRFDMIVVADMATGLVRLAQRRDVPGGAVDYELNGVVRLDLPLFHSLPFHEKGSFTLPGASR